MFILIFVLFCFGLATMELCMEYHAAWLMRTTTVMFGM